MTTSRIKDGGSAYWVTVSELSNGGFLWVIDLVISGCIHKRRILEHEPTGLEIDEFIRESKS